MVLRKRKIAKICIDGECCYRTVKYSKRKYLGDPLNIARLLSRLQADELHVISLSPPWNKHEGIIKLLSKYTTCPLAYGGYIFGADQIDLLMSFGIEKVILGKSAFTNYDLLCYGSDKYGRQSIVASVDVRFDPYNQVFSVWSNHGNTLMADSLSDVLSNFPFSQIGELSINFIDYDGLTLPHSLLDLLDSEKLPQNIPLTLSCGFYYDATINYALGKDWVSGIISSRRYASAPYSPSSCLTCFYR